MDQLRNLAFAPGGLLQSVTRFWWLVNALLLLGLVGAFGFSATRDKVVPAQGEVVLTDVAQLTLEGDTSNLRVLARNRVGDEVLRIQSAPVLRMAAEDLGITVPELRRSISARPAVQSTAVVVEGRASTASKSADRVNSLITAYETLMGQQRAERANEIVTALDDLIATEDTNLAAADARLAEIDAELRASAEAQAEGSANAENILRNLQSTSSARQDAETDQREARLRIGGWERQAISIQADLEIFDNGIDFVRLAQGASGSAEPNMKRNLLLGGLLGLVVGTALAWSLNGNEVQRNTIDD